MDFNSWISGFIDGEGSFNIRATERNTECVFCVAVRDDDAEILQRIQAHLGIGRIRLTNPPSGCRTNANPQARWWVCSKADTAKLVAFLDAYPLQAKKRRDYEIWREAVELKQQFISSQGSKSPEVKKHNDNIR